jgi:ABC-type sugar transport system substrate-binding protein
MNEIKQVPRDLRGRTVHRWLVMGFAVALIGALAFNGETATSNAKAAAATTHYKIGSVINDMTNPFLAVVGSGEQAEAKTLGSSVTVLSGNVAGAISLSQQVTDIQTFITEKVNAILVTASNSVGIIPAIKKANAAGIPVIAVNTPVGTVTGPKSVNTGGAKVVTFVGADNTAYGVALADLVVKATGGKGNIVMIHGTLGTEPDTLRFAGMKSVFAKYPGIKVLETPTDNWTNSANITAVQDLLSKYPGTKLKAVVATGPEMYAGAEYARSHGNKTINFMAGDYPKEVRTAIESGALYGTVNQDPALQGQLGVEYAIDWLTGHKSLVPQPLKYTGLPLITKTNVKSVPALWSS